MQNKILMKSDSYHVISSKLYIFLINCLIEQDVPRWLPMAPPRILYERCWNFVNLNWQGKGQKKKDRCVCFFHHSWIPNWSIKNPSQNQFFWKPFLPWWLLPFPAHFSVKKSIWAYLDLWVSYQMAMGFLRKVIWTEKKIKGSKKFQQPVLSKANWANWVFIQSCSNSFQIPFWANLDLRVLYKTR